MTLEQTLDRLAQILQQVPTVYDLPCLPARLRSPLARTPAIDRA